MDQFVVCTDSYGSKTIHKIYDFKPGYLPLAGDIITVHFGGLSLVGQVTHRHLNPSTNKVIFYLQDVPEDLYLWG